MWQKERGLCSDCRADQAWREVGNSVRDVGRESKKAASNVAEGAGNLVGLAARGTVGVGASLVRDTRNVVVAVQEAKRQLEAQKAAMVQMAANLEKERFLERCRPQVERAVHASEAAARGEGDTAAILATSVIQWIDVEQTTGVPQKWPEVAKNMHATRASLLCYTSVDGHEKVELIESLAAAIRERDDLKASGASSAEGRLAGQASELADMRARFERERVSETKYSVAVAGGLASVCVFFSGFFVQRGPGWFLLAVGLIGIMLAYQVAQAREADKLRKSEIEQRELTFAELQAKDRAWKRFNSSRRGALLSEAVDEMPSLRAFLR